MSVFRHYTFYASGSKHTDTNSDMNNISCSRAIEAGNHSDFQYHHWVVNNVIYGNPAELGRAPLCNLCANQLECLAGRKWLSFAEVSNGSTD